jgi:hypothetical protein
VEHGREIVEARLERHGASVYSNRGAIGLALLRAATARWRPMRRTPLALVAALALVVAAGGCGSQITVPDQGIIVTGCQVPSACYRSDCSCERADVAEGGKCIVDRNCGDMGDPSMCFCPTGVPLDTDLGTHYDSTCLETAQACVGRGVFCGGPGALCKAPGSTCDGSGDPPMLVPMLGMLEPHCQYVKDICCGDEDGGVSTD